MQFKWNSVFSQRIQVCHKSLTFVSYSVQIFVWTITFILLTIYHTLVSASISLIMTFTDIVIGQISSDPNGSIFMYKSIRGWHQVSVMWTVLVRVTFLTLESLVSNLHLQANALPSTKEIVTVMTYIISTRLLGFIALESQVWKPNIFLLMFAWAMLLRGGRGNPCNGSHSGGGF